jgi:hypothetical protein
LARLTQVIRVMGSAGVSLKAFRAQRILAGGTPADATATVAIPSELAPALSFYL